MSLSEAELDMLPMDALVDAAACLKVMAHPVRLRIVDILMQGDFPVHTIAQMCEIKQHQACEHLRLMQSWGLLGSERRARSVFYKITSPQLPGLLGCIRQHCALSEQYQEASGGKTT
jgi:ArsR family transcriptional regulator, zinc-responsive transcriptional repressor